MEIRVITQEEQKYAYKQNTQLEGQTGSIGHLQGNFGESGKDFYNHKWNSHCNMYQTEDFQTELETVINTLRSEKYGLLASRRGMAEYAGKFPDSVFVGEEGRECGFRVDTEKHAYLIRCRPAKGEYNIYCYVAEHLDQHMKKARQGICFRDADYREEFRIPDGGTVILKMPWGSKLESVCRFIDECHTEFFGHIHHVNDIADHTHGEGQAACEPKTEEQEKEKRNQER